jgi:myo-inositol-1-phosphate synthase
LGDEGRTLGVWLVGALGDIATTAVVGAGAIGRDLAPTRGLVTAIPELERLDLVPLDRLVFGGHDVREANPVASARVLAREAQLFPEELVTAVSADLEGLASRVKPGVAFGCGNLVSRLESAGSKERRSLGLAKALEVLRGDLRAFREQTHVERVVVVHLASTEPQPTELPELANEEGARALIEKDDPRVPASVLYALAAADEGLAYVNFTPSLGATPPGVSAAFERLKVPHAGRDGKTGETLVRSALAPLFLARNLKVLSWVGYNILGNRDGEALADPAANVAKTKGKDRVLGRVLGDQLGSSTTRIDYVPSIGDWKTAWDHIHFEGFLGTKGTLQFTWRGPDSALAAPLVLDLVRLLEIAQRQGRAGAVAELACFFKDPVGTSEASLARQFDAFLAFAGEIAGAPRRA